MSMRHHVTILAGLLLLAGCGHRQDKTATAPEDLMAAAGKQSRRQMVAEAFDPQDADARRLGIVELTEEDWALREPFLKGYAALAHDEEPIVRSMAVMALGSAGDATYLPVLLEALERDPVNYVRVDAAGALIVVQGDAAIEPLSRHAQQDASMDVRLRCIRALAHYHRPAVIQTLLTCLGDDEFGIRWTARQALCDMTGEDAEYDGAAWSRCLAAKSDPFARPAEPSGRSRRPFGGS